MLICPQMVFTNILHYYQIIIKFLIEGKMDSHFWGLGATHKIDLIFKGDIKLI